MRKALKSILLFLLVVCNAAIAMGRARDTTKVFVPEISYHGLDSIIRSNEYTAIYFWPSWCASCIPKIPALLDLMRQKKSVTFISVNDPNSAPFLSKKLIFHPEVLKGYFRIKRYGPRPMISINDRSQFRYFNWYFTRRTGKDEVEQIRRFLLFDHSGKLLYASKTDYLDKLVDSVSAVLQQYE